MKTQSKFILACLLVFNGGIALAITTSALAADNGLQTATVEADNSVWPALPGESLNDVARLFYPKNVVQQQQFVNKALDLNANKLPNLKAAEPFSKPTLLLVPSRQSQSKNMAMVKPSAKAATRPRLQISYSLDTGSIDVGDAVKNIPTKLQQEYEDLVNKNSKLKQQLTVLKEKIVFLETKLDNLKLVWEKTLNASIVKEAPIANNAASKAVDNKPVTEIAPAPVVAANTANVVANLPSVSLPSVSPANPSDVAVTSDVANSTVGKKVFKNLNVVKPKLETVQTNSNWKDYLNNDWSKLALVLGLLAALSALALKKYREHMFAKMSFVATRMQSTIQETIIDFGGYLKPKEPEIVSPEAKQEAQAAKEVEARLDSTLAEAKLLMSVNRHQDAIAHLKLTIEAQPKACINHWLYLLEIYRKLNLKEDFESYAKGLHQIYNVMTPVWYETAVAMVVPQSLEEFPHIMEKLYKVWPGDLATVYLRGLISDNRGGERVGFGKAVFDEVLMLIEVLDIQKG